MTFLPIVGRELRVAARRSGTYWLRLGAALAALLIGSWVWVTMLRAPTQRLGITMFIALSIFSYVYCLLVGISRTADCMSEEKREGTLGLLFLTDLKGYDVVFGKLAATSLAALYGMLAIFPILAIPLLLGGVAPAEFQRVVIVCLNNMFLSLAVGMFCSAISRDERKAMAATLALILFLTAGLPMLGVWVGAENNLRPQQHAGVLLPFFIASPAYTSALAFDEMFKEMTREKFNFFYASLAVQHTLSWALLVWACLIVPRTWQDQPASAGRVRWRDRWRQMWQGPAEVRRAFRHRLLAQNAFLWLAGRDRAKAVLVWGFLGLGALLWAWGLAKYNRSWIDEGAFVWTALILHTGLKWWLASEAAKRFSLDRRSGALELLLATPITVKEILAGQLLALVRQFGWPALAVLLVDAVFLVAGAQRNSGNESEWVMVCLAGMGMFVLDLLTLAWVGMWMGLCSYNANRAAMAALVRVCVLPWLGFALVATVFGVLELTNPGFFNRMNEKVMLAIWFGLGVANNILFGSHARRKLNAEFRVIAVDRFEARKPSGAWGRILGELVRHLRKK